MNFDITYTFMLPILQFFAKMTHSYGWAIILLTLAIRMLVWPLVTSSTRSMQRMSQLQPKLKEIQDRYKDEPEVFQKKATEFYQKNKINPLGGCLPTLVQLPVLIALFSTFTGPPFQDKAIPVKVTLAKPADAANVKTQSAPVSGASSPYVAPDGAVAKFAVSPGDQTMVWGRNATGQDIGGPNVIDFHIQAVAGDPPANFHPLWKIEHDPNGAKMDPQGGTANFPMEGEVIVGAAFPNEQNVEIPIKVEPGAGNGGNNWFGGGGPDSFRSKTAESQPMTITVNGKPVTLALVPGPSSVVAGSQNVKFDLKVISGSLDGVKPVWRIFKDANSATIDENGRATFPKPGEVTIAAMVPGEAAAEPFYFITSLGKVSKGMDLFKPENFDCLGMLLAFAGTMYWSSMLMAPTSTGNKEQEAIQKQTQQTMPIAVTAMFFFFALPAGVYLYLVVSNMIQTLQTWLIYKSPAPALADVDDVPPAGGAGGDIIDVGDGSNGSGSVIKVSDTKKKANKKKNQ